MRGSRETCGRRSPRLDGPRSSESAPSRMSSTSRCVTYFPEKIFLRFFVRVFGEVFPRFFVRVFGEVSPRFFVRVFGRVFPCFFVRRRLQPG